MSAMAMSHFVCAAVDFETLANRKPTTVYLGKAEVSWLSEVKLLLVSGKPAWDRETGRETFLGMEVIKVDADSHLGFGVSK